MSRTMPMAVQSSIPRWNWGPALMPFIGVALILFKTLVIICGLQLLRYAVLVDQRERLKFRLLGLSMAMAIGPLAEVSAYAFAPQSLLAPLDGFDVIWNILLAPYTLGESITSAKVMGTGLVFAGAVSAPMFGPHHKPPETMYSLRNKFLSKNFLGWALVCIALAIFAYLALPPKNSHSSARAPAMRGLILAMSGGFVAGQRFFLSSTATVLHTSFDEGNWDLWSSPLAYFIVGGMFFVAITNAILLNKGLAEFEAMFMIPTFVGTSIITTSVSAAVILKETAWLAWWRLLGYWFGILLVVSGLVIIAKDARYQLGGCRESDGARQMQAARPLNGSTGSSTVNVVSCINIGDQETQD
ncbi:unnamed protein product [Cladocopium goreaui]|uniref:Magnesium transporter NIPA2 n=1 Tax=Cladocopium goreaui TaxID=2562237 RepID=A0A9P1BWB8_9DINO|nr:unnamed protein product [Cladocopium goreaui]